MKTFTFAFALTCAVTTALPTQAMETMQGGSAPMDARDPHAYSSGYTLTEGPYALPGERQLKLADEHAFWSVLANRFEYQEESQASLFDVQAWYGTTYNRLSLFSEGEWVNGDMEDVSTDLLWQRAYSAYFDTLFGIRFDQKPEGKNRRWLALGLQGLAPYWFELNVTGYLADDGRSAISTEAEYELLLSQKWILQPRAELNAYSKNDIENGIGSGVSDINIGLRLRYEITRQFAPYAGAQWNNTYGKTADYRKATGEDTSETQLIAGLKFWF